MTEPVTVPADTWQADECEHMCSFGCGNQYAFVVVSVTDSTTQFLCVPCFVQTAMSMVEAITSPESPMVQEAVANYQANQPDIVGTRGKKASLIGGIDMGPSDSMFDEFEYDVEFIDDAE